MLASSNARTTFGSKWDPADFTISARADSAEVGALYERRDVMTS